MNRIFVIFPLKTIIRGSCQERQIFYNLFNVLGVNPILAREFTVEEDQPNGNRVVIIGHGL